MQRYYHILNNNTYNYMLTYNDMLEERREYCHHDLNHFLSVARIGYIIVLEKKLNISKDVVYASALLHDIGRYKEVLGDSSHELSSAEIAREILKDSTYTNTEIDLIIDSIISHRVVSNSVETLSDVIYRADKLSRVCSRCSVRLSCKWSDDKKNKFIKY